MLRKSTWRPALLGAVAQTLTGAPLQPHAIVVNGNATTLTPYVSIHNGRQTALVHHSYAEHVAAAFFEGKACIPVRKGGRNALVFRFPLGSGETGIIRTCRRGGLVRRLFKDAYPFSNRPLREFRVHLYAYSRKLPVPEPLGVFWERKGIAFRGAVATREIEAVTLFTALKRLQSNAGRFEPLLIHAGRAVRHMHELGICHADLQLGNILVTHTGIHLIDLDKARVFPKLSTLRRARNLLRLRRSLGKNGFPPELFERILDGYGADVIPHWLDVAYRVKGMLSDGITRRKRRRNGR